MGHAKTPEEEEMAALTNEMVLMALNRVLQIFTNIYSRFAGIITGSSCAFTIVKCLYCLYNIIVYGIVTF